MFTGHETKVMKNSNNSQSKKSKIEVKMNSYILVIILIQALCCLFAGVYETIWENLEGSKYTYMEFGVCSTTSGSDETCSYSTVGMIAQGFGTWFLALMNFVPISLIVTFEIVKFAQA